MRKNLEVKPYIFPQPVLVIGTYDENGHPNAMNAAWGSVADYNKVFVVLSGHKTTDNLLKNKAFTVSFGDVDHVVACDYIGIVSANNEPNKFEKAGFTATKSEFVNAPIINELPLTLECEVESYDEEQGYLIGVIKNVSMDESIMDEKGLPNMDKFRPIIFETAHAKYMELGKVVGNAFSDGKKLK